MNEYFEVLKKEIADKEAKFATALEELNNFKKQNKKVFDLVPGNLISKTISYLIIPMWIIRIPKLK